MCKSVFWQLLEPMQQEFKQRLFSQMGRDLHFIFERRGFESWARGAGSLVLHHFYARSRSPRTGVDSKLKW